MKLSIKYQHKLDDLEKLLAKTNTAVDLEKHINESINAHKRNRLVENLKVSMQQLEDFATKTVRTEFVKHENLVVNSQYRYWTRGGKPVEGYLATIIPDTMIRMLIKKGGPMHLAHLDNIETRITYLPEYRDRFILLIEKIEQGEVDELLDKFPHDLLHMINGAHGELLLNIGVPPGESQTAKKLIEQERARLIIVEITDSSGKGINGSIVEYYQKRWKRILDTTGEQYIDGWLSGLTDDISDHLRVRINNKGNIQEKTQKLENNRTFTFQTKQIQAQILESTGNKGVSETQIHVKQGNKILRETYTDEKGAASFELFSGDYNFVIQTNHCSQTKPIQLANNIKISIQTGRVHSKSGKCSHYYCGDWFPFTQDMELLPFNYYFKFSDGTQDTLYFIKGGTVNEIH